MPHRHGLQTQELPFNRAEYINNRKVPKRCADEMNSFSFLLNFLLFILLCNAKKFNT